MDVNKIIEKLSINDMPSEDMKLMATLCGVEVAVKVMQQMAGLSLYVPKNVAAILVTRLLKAEPNPEIKKIAILCSVSERYVRSEWRKLNGGDNKQADLFLLKENNSCDI